MSFDIPFPSHLLSTPENVIPAYVESWALPRAMADGGWDTWQLHTCKINYHRRDGDDVVAVDVESVTTIVTASNAERVGESLRMACGETPSSAIVEMSDGARLALVVESFRLNIWALMPEPPKLYQVPFTAEWLTHYDGYRPIDVVLLAGMAGLQHHAEYVEWCKAMPPSIHKVVKAEYISAALDYEDHCARVREQVASGELAENSLANVHALYVAEDWDRLHYIGEYFMAREEWVGAIRSITESAEARGRTLLPQVREFIVMDEPAEEVSPQLEFSRKALEEDHQYCWWLSTGH